MYASAGDNLAVAVLASAEMLEGVEELGDLGPVFSLTVPARKAQRRFLPPPVRNYASLPVEPSMRFFIMFATISTNWLRSGTLRELSSGPTPAHDLRENLIKSDHLCLVPRGISIGEIRSGEGMLRRPKVENLAQASMKTIEQ